MMYNAMTLRFAYHATSAQVRPYRHACQGCGRCWVHDDQQVFVWHDGDDLLNLCDSCDTQVMTEREFPTAGAESAGAS